MRFCEWRRRFAILRRRERQIPPSASLAHIREGSGACPEKRKRRRARDDTNGRPHMRRVRSNEAEMPFLEHLEELRWRIIWSLAAVAGGLLIGFYVTLHFDLVARLEAPVVPFLKGHHVVGTHPADGLQIMINAAMMVGAVFAFPVVLYQAWAVLSPAL